jgi:uncharacterized protein (DUF302 family)
MKNSRLIVSLITVAALPLLATLAKAELIKVESPYSVQETADRFVAIAEEKKLKVFARIDHAKGAKSVNLELRPTELIIFGNPMAGTPAIQAEQSMGLSLPLKVLAWQDEAGKVWLGYDTPASEFSARGLPADHPVAQKMTEALKGLTGAAVKK